PARKDALAETYRRFHPCMVVSVGWCSNLYIFTRSPTSNLLSSAKFLAITSALCVPSSPTQIQTDISISEVLHVRGCVARLVASPDCGACQNFCVYRHQEHIKKPKLLQLKGKGR